MASACGKENFPQEALEEFTKFALECIQQQDSKLELRETSISYFSDISKILKSQFAPILDTVLQPILEVACTDDGVVEKVQGKEKKAIPLVSDSEDEEVVGLGLDSNFLDEKAASIQALGNICLNCAGIMQPHMSIVMETLKQLETYVEDNIRFHVVQAYAHIAFGLLRLHTGNPDSEENYRWERGLPAKTPLPAPVLQYLQTIIFPRF